MSAWVALWLGVAWAHPFSAERIGHRTVIELGTEQVVVDYRIEVPVRQVLRELEASGETPDAYTAARLDELADGLLLKHDGALVALERVADREEVPKGNSRFFSFHLVLQAGFGPDPGPQRFKLINENFPADTAFHYVEVQVDPQVQVLASSLFDQKEGQIRNLREARWRMEEASRVTELLVQLDPHGPLDRLLGPLVGDSAAPRMAHRALAVPWHLRWLSGQLGTGAALAGLVLALGIGAVAGAGRRLRAAAGQGLGLLALTAPVLLLGARFVPQLALPWVPLVSAALVLSAALWLLRGRGSSQVPGLAVLVAGLGLQQAPLTVALIACFGLGSLGGAWRGAAVRRRALGVVLLLAACALAVRGLGIAGLL